MITRLFGKCCTLFFTGYIFYLAWHNPVCKQTLMYSRCKNMYWFCLYVIVPNQDHLLSLIILSYRSINAVCDCSILNFIHWILLCCFFLRITHCWYSRLWIYLSVCRISNFLIHTLLSVSDLSHVFSSVQRDLNFIDHTSDLGWKE